MDPLSSLDPGKRAKPTNCRASGPHHPMSSDPVACHRQQGPKHSTGVPAPGNGSRHVPSSAVNQQEQNTWLRQQALAEARKGNYLHAIQILNHLIACNPNSATDFNNRGLIYFQSGQSAEAIRDYSTALRLNPKLDSAYNNRANYYAAQGQLLEAIADYEQAINFNPGNVRARINQGITFRDLKAFDQAIECFDLALGLGQLDGHIYAERGRTYHLWGDWNYAVADYQRALELLPPVPGASHLSYRLNNSHRLRQHVEQWMQMLLS